MYSNIKILKLLSFICCGTVLHGCLTSQSQEESGLIKINGSESVETSSTESSTVPGIKDLSILPGHHILKFNFEYKDKTKTTEIRVVQKDTDNISGPEDGTLAFEGLENEFTIENLENGKTYFFSVYARDKDGHYSKPAKGQGTPGLEFFPDAYLKASDPGNSDNFGRSVALSGDILAVGASREDGDKNSTMTTPNNNTQDSGAVYIFTRSNNKWTQTAYLKASNPGVSDEFGASVALDGDTLAVGAPGESGDSNSTVNNPNDNAPRAGAIYVFKKSGTTWMQQGYLKTFNSPSEDRFGLVLALQGDTIVSGVVRDAGDANATMTQPNSNAQFAGAAHIFVRNNNIWTQQGYLKARNAETGDFFGTSVDIHGDTIVVGARYEEGDANSTMENPNDGTSDPVGAGYVFKRTGTTWTQEAYLKSFNAEVGDEFGTAVAIHEGYIAVGAFGEDGDINSTKQNPNNNASSAGAIYVYKKTGNKWVHHSYLKAASAEQRNFGEHIVMNDQFIVPSSRAVGDFRGRMHVLAFHAGLWEEIASLQSFNIGADDLFVSTPNTLAVDGRFIVGCTFNEDGDKNSTIENPNDLLLNSGACYTWETP